MLNYDFQKRNGRTKTLFLYDSIKSDILAGRLKAQERLPSRRELAEHLPISVMTAENAYGLLEEEGYIYSRPKSGFYVSRLPLADTMKTAASDGSDAAGQDEQGRINMLPEDDLTADTDAAVPNLSRYVRRVLSEKPEVMQMRPPHLGCAVLRNAIAGFLGRYRGMSAEPSHIIIGSGAEYLYGTVVQLLGRGMIFGIEKPSYEKIELIYRANGARVEYLEMENDGISTAALERCRAGTLHISPYHSYPTGVTASAEKRLEYLSWAEKTEGYIIEDDFDSEFAFYRKPIDTLYSMDMNHRVIYMNTFSRSISPSIRAAYMILPDNLLEQYMDRLGFYSCPVPVLDQYVLASFIEDGAFERHLARLRHSGRSSL